jgi:endoglucanase
MCDMDVLMKRILDTAGISGYEDEIGAVMKEALKKTGAQVYCDTFGNIISQKGNGKKKIMICAHMDEIGLIVKFITKEGFLKFIKVGGIDDRILPGQRLVVKSKKGDAHGIVGTRPPHLQKDEERTKLLKYDDMFIDIGCKSREEAEKRVEIGDPVVFYQDSGVLNGDLHYGRAIDDRIGCYVLVKIMEKLRVKAQVFAVATAQEEVGLKGARTASFKINPDFAIAIDTTLAGDTPQIKETESALKLGGGPAITIMEAAGRGVIVSEKIKDLFKETAKKNKIKYQIDVLEGGMTDGAIIYMNREGIPTGVISIPTRYVHSPVSVFSMADVEATVDLCVKVIEKVASE